MTERMKELMEGAKVAIDRVGSETLVTPQETHEALTALVEEVQSRIDALEDDMAMAEKLEGELDDEEPEDAEDGEDAE